MQVHLKRVTVTCRFSFLFTLSLLLAVDRDGITFLSFLSAICHEMGHIAALLILSESPIKITLRGMGFSLQHHSIPKKAEMLSLMSGPACNFIFFAVFRHFPRFAVVNLVTGIFNLIPLSFTDGGRIMSLVLLKYLPPNAAVHIEKIISFVFSVPVFALALLVIFNNPYNYTLLILFVYIISSVLTSSGLD